MISEHRHWEKAKVTQRHVVEVPAWGYLESLTVHFTRPVPNMDVEHPLRIIIDPLFAHGDRFEVTCQFRNEEL